MAKAKKMKLVLVVSCLIMLLLVVTAPFVGKWANVLAVMIFGVYCFFNEKIYSYVLLFAMFPFANIFKIDPSSLSMLTICEILLALSILFDIVVHKRALPGKFIVLLFLTLSYVIIISIIDINIMAIVKLAIRLILIYYFFNEKSEKANKETTILLISYSLSFSMIVMMALSQMDFYIEKISDYLRIVQYSSNITNQSIITRNGGLMTDPNYCSMAIIITLSLLGVLYYFKKIGVIYWFLCIPLILLGFTTYSKSYFICVALYLIIVTLFVLFPKHKFWAVVSSSAIAVVTYIALNGQIEVINQIFQRFHSGDISTGRSMLNEQYITYIWQNIKILFFGAGYNVDSIVGINNVHNIYIESVFRIGLIGCLIFLITLINCFSKKKGRKKIIGYLPLFFVLLMYSALAGLTSYELVYYIILCGGAARYINQTTESTINMTEERI